MSDVAGMILTLAVGFAGGFLAQRLRLPGGAIIGALVSAAALHMAIGTLEPLPTPFRTVAQIMIGGVIGTTLTRSPLSALRPIALPAGVAILVLVSTGVSLAFAFQMASGLPIVTALFSMAPGGASDMTAAALKLDADVGLIAAIHVVRQIAVFVIVVSVFSRVLGRGGSITPSAPHH